MDIRPLYKVELRKEGSEKTLMLIDNLNEDEAYKVFKNIKYPTIKGGYVKVLIFKDMVLRTVEI